MKHEKLDSADQSRGRDDAHEEKAKSASAAQKRGDNPRRGKQIDGVAEVSADSLRLRPPIESRARNTRQAPPRLALLLSFACCCLCANPSSWLGRPTSTGSQPTWQVLAGLLNSDDHPTGPSNSSTVTIRTDQGQLFRGSRWHDDNQHDRDDGPGLVQFLGIRYASAPVKRLRFMPPTPFTYPRGQPGQVHDFTRPGPICMQKLPLEISRAQWNSIQQLRTGSSNENNNETSSDSKAALQSELMHRLGLKADRRLRARLSQFVQSEDCLNLNIYTPIEALGRRRVSPAGQRNPNEVAPENKDGPGASPTRPVLVLVHGHSLDFGSGSLLEARKFAQNNQLVVITLNYRLNILGFPPKFGSTSRGNLGLLDQVAALHWLRSNVRSFGGSPENITLMGFRRGAIFVHLLMLSPLAKGLFQRAIIEDGTALSPVVANNLLVGPNSQLQLQQQVALAHLRLLAQLCGCPGVSSQTSNASTASNELGGPSELELRAANLLTFECLKSTPSELLVQPIPSELIDLNRLEAVQAGLLPLASKWRAPLERLLELLSKEELRRRLDVQSAGPTGSGARQTSEEFAQTSERLAQQLEEFKSLFRSASSGSPTSPSGQQQQVIAIKPEQLNRLAALLVVVNLRNETSKVAHRLSELLLDALGAIYLPSNETLPIGPVFSSQLEPGTILASGQSSTGLDPAGDLANAMLEPHSPFGHFDLMLGLSSELVELRPKSSVGRVRGLGERELARLPLEKFQAGHLLERGLTEEQAIGQVNLFVRSFYRFHQQEISNSIVSQYLNRKSQMTSEHEESAGSRTGDGQEQAARRKQLFLLHSLQELYEDALLQVPMLKTGLIHSLHQLDALADLFVTQQINKLNHLAAASANQANGQNSSSASDQELAEVHSHWDLGEPGSATTAGLGQLVSEPRRLQEEFYAFAKSFYRTASIWPVRLQAPNSSPSLGRDELLESKRPRATFLYQFASFSRADFASKLAHRIQAAQARLERQTARTHQKAREELKGALMSLKDELDGAANLEQLELGLACSFQPSDSGTNSMLARLVDWICREQIGATLANFVRTGNANSMPGEAESHPNDRRPTFEARLERYKSECLANQPGESDHHHLVQLASDRESSRPDRNFEILVEQQPVPVAVREDDKTSSCRNGIAQLSIEFLMTSANLQETSRERGSREDWLVFNVFGQQMATFDALTALEDPHRAPFSLDSFVSSSASGPERESFDSKVAFWANFVPALNCSRTQPIGAQSLSLFSQANSTLLNMNLNSNCQLQQASGSGASTTKTASSLLQRAQTRIRHELAEQIERTRQRVSLGARSQLGVGASLSTASQNHHTPRMANSTGQQHEDVLADATGSSPPGGTSASGSAPSGWLTAIGGGGGGTTGNAGNAAARRFLQFISRQSASATFWLFSAFFLLFLVLVVLVGSFVFARRRKSTQVETVARENGLCPNTQHSPSLQLDAGFLQEVDQQIVEQQQQQQSHPASLEHPVAEVNLANELTYQPQSSSTSFMTPQGYHQQPPEEFLVAQPEVESHQQILLPPPPSALTDEPRAHQSNETYLRRQEHHLPTCNLLMMQDHQQQQQPGEHQLPGMLSSSSETTTTQRAQSSVSLVSTSGTLTNANSATNRTAATIKKRVKISDPKRTNTLGHFTATPTQVYGAAPATSEHYCPIHRTSSNVNLMPNPQQQFDLYQQAGGGLESQMARSASSYDYEPEQPQLVMMPSRKFDQQRTTYDNASQLGSQTQSAVCPAHERFEDQTAHQQLLLMSQLYLEGASKAGSLVRRR